MHYVFRLPHSPLHPFLWSDIYSFIHSLAYSKKRSHADNFTPVSLAGYFAPRRIQFEVQWLEVVFHSTVRSLESRGDRDVVSILEAVSGVLPRQLCDDLHWVRPGLDDRSTATACISPSPTEAYIRSDIVTTISHNGLNNFDKTDSEYLLAPTDNPIEF